MALKRLIARFLRRFSTTSAKSPDGIPPLDAAEVISRFLFSSNHYTESTGRVKPQALSPMLNEQTTTQEVSVYRVSNLRPPEIWDICASFVDNPSKNRIAKARANCQAQWYLSNGLGIEPDGAPHKCHANVVGWPSSKSELKLLQQKIAEHMALLVKPN